MSDLRVICTNRDGSVAVIVPAQECIDDLSLGSAISTFYSRWRAGLHRYLCQHWPGHWLAWLTSGEVPLHIARAWEIHKFVRCAEWHPDRTQDERKGLAAHWVDSLINGGLDERAAVWLIAQKDAPAFSTALEIVHKSQIPPCRRHRNAWRRSHNGGPIWVDETAAQALDEGRMWAAYDLSTAINRAPKLIGPQ